VGAAEAAIRDLDLPPGYYTERDETGVYLLDPGGRRVMRLPRFRPSEERLEGSEKWGALCSALLVRLSEQNAECERLRNQVARLAERVEAVEAERDQAHTIAEDMYGFFRRRVREVVDHKRNLGKRNVR